jgi:hypothetical protein
MYSKLNKVEVPFFTFGHRNLIQKEHCLAVSLLGSMGSEKQIGPHIYLLCIDEKYKEAIKQKSVTILQIIFVTEYNACSSE